MTYPSANMEFMERGFYEVKFCESDETEMYIEMYATCVYSRHKYNSEILRAKLHVYYHVKTAYVVELDVLSFDDSYDGSLKLNSAHVNTIGPLIMTLKPPGIDDLRCSDKIYEKFFKSQENPKPYEVFKLVLSAIRSVLFIERLDCLKASSLGDHLSHDILFEIAKTSAKHEISKEKITSNPFKVQLKKISRTSSAWNWRVIENTVIEEKDEDFRECHCIGRCRGDCIAWKDFDLTPY